MILAVGVASIAAGVLYTGGPRPYGYAGLGELFVFLFFGLVAVNGSYYVQLERLDWLPFGLSIAVGCLATAILVVNNVRDIETDRRAGKPRWRCGMGREGTRRLYLALIGGAYLALLVTLAANGGPWWALLGFASAPLAIKPAAGGDQPHGRPGAQRRPGRNRCPARRLQPARLSRASDRGCRVGTLASARAAGGDRGNPLLAAVSRALRHRARAS